MQPLSISDDQARFFDENGYLVVPGALSPTELEAVRAEMDSLTRYGSETRRDDPDFFYGQGHRTGQEVLRRIEYVIDKSDACKRLLGNPFILRSVEKLMGPDLIPTWDSMVLKLPGEGIIVPWHRDAGTEFVGDSSIFNVDFYLDEADEETCVWVIPGSHRWTAGEVSDWLAQRRDADCTKEEFRRTGAVPALMKPGDVLFHNILVLHGSPANSSPRLRRVVYYEFRPAHVEEAVGPHVPAYIPLKQKVLLKCVELRRRAAQFADEAPYSYRPPAPYDTVTLSDGEALATYRYPHSEYWRK